ncbi:dedicator of cytokinesis protein 9 [Clonorchis sinensis]|uniref:Dedicator of cytokinesis protein 9 n=1 Tax=Clonorchis sinensis TaxID=79923 RepID=G7YLB3_CLOSI|nr:dedicator of cytokinesis protein 9 [Clonorchis sinensis]
MPPSIRVAGSNENINSYGFTILAGEWQWGSCIPEPIDYEHYVSNRKNSIINDPHRELILFPVDDLRLIRLPNTHRVSDAGVPPDALKPDALISSPLGRHAIAFLANNEWIYVHQPSALYRGQWWQLPRDSTVETILGPLLNHWFSVDQLDASDQKMGSDVGGWAISNRASPSHGSTRVTNTSGSRPWTAAVVNSRSRLDGTQALDLLKATTATDGYESGGRRMVRGKTRLAAVDQPSLLRDGALDDTPTPPGDEPTITDSVFYSECALAVGTRELYSTYLRIRESDLAAGRKKNNAGSEAIVLEPYCLRRLQAADLSGRLTTVDRPINSSQQSTTTASSPAHTRLREGLHVIAPVGWRAFSHTTDSENSTVVFLDTIDAVHPIGDNWLKLDRSLVTQRKLRSDQSSEVFLYFDTSSAGSETRQTWLRLIQRALAAERSWQRYGYNRPFDYSAKVPTTITDQLSIPTGETMTDQQKSVSSDQSFESISVRNALHRYAQETEFLINHQRQKDRLKLITIYPEIRFTYDQSVTVAVERARAKSSILPQHTGLALYVMDSRTGRSGSFSSKDVVESAKLPKAVVPFPDRTANLCSRRFLVTCLNLKSRVQAVTEQVDSGIAAQLDNPEPYFVTMFLLNTTDGRRVSEDFYWNPNSHLVDSMIPAEQFTNVAWAANGPEMQQQPRNSISVPSQRLSRGPAPPPPFVVTPLGHSITVQPGGLNECRSAIFSVPQAISTPGSIYLVVRVDKVLNGPINAAVEKYTKAAGSQLSAEERLGTTAITETKYSSALHRSMLTYCRHLGRYRMPFAWGARSLSSQSQSIPLFRMDQAKLAEASFIQLIQSFARFAECNSLFTTGLSSIPASTAWSTLANGIPTVWDDSKQDEHEMVERYLKLQTIPIRLDVVISELTEQSASGGSHLGDATLLTADLLPLLPSYDGNGLNFSLPSSHPPLRPNEIIREVEHRWDFGLPATTPAAVPSDSASGTLVETDINVSSSGTSSLSRVTKLPHALASASTRSFTRESSNISVNLQLPSSATGLQPTQDTSAITQSKTNSLDRPPPRSAGADASNRPSGHYPLEVVPFTTFLNSLYISPKVLNLAGKHGSSRARNLSCFIELRSADDLQPSSALKAWFPKFHPPHFFLERQVGLKFLGMLICKVFYSRPSTRQPPFDSWFNTAVLYHEPSPQFNDTAKVSLPLHLTPQHHLLFRFYHVSVVTAGGLTSKERPSSKKPLESSVGFAWLPILGTDGNLNTGNFQLPISSDLPPGYLKFSSSPQARGSLHTPSPVGTGSDMGLNWLENGKPLFTVQLDCLSSVYTHDAVLSRFFRTCGELLPRIWTVPIPSTAAAPTAGCKPKATRVTFREDPVEQTSFPVLPVDVERSRSFRPTDTACGLHLCNAVKALLLIDQTALMHFLPAILAQFMEIIMFSFDAAAITSTSIKICEQAKADSDKGFQANLSIPLHHALVRSLVVTLADVNLAHHILTHFFTNLWFPLALVSKAMAQYLISSQKIKSDRSNESRFTSSFSDDLALLIKLIGARLAPFDGSPVSAAALSCQVSLSGEDHRDSSLTRVIFRDVPGNRNSSTSLPVDVNRVAQQRQAVSVVLLGEETKDVSRTNTLQSTTTTDQLVAQAGRIASLGYEVNACAVMGVTARFIGHLFNLMDRGYVMKRIRDLFILLEIGPRMPVNVVDRRNELRFQLLNCLSQHEHFVQINLPTLNPYHGTGPPVHDLRLTERFLQEHFLVGAILSSVSCLLAGCADTGSWAAGGPPTQLHRQPLCILRNLLAKHTLDPRYAASKQCQARIAALYLPLIPLVLDHPDVFGPPAGKSLHSLSSGESASISDGSGGGSIFDGSVALSAGSSSSAAYLTKDDKVAPHILDRIAGMPLRNAQWRRARDDSSSTTTAQSTQSSDGDSVGRLQNNHTASSHTGSTLTLTGLDMVNGGGSVGEPVADDEVSVNRIAPVRSRPTKLEFDTSIRMADELHETNNRSLFWHLVFQGPDQAWSSQVLALVGVLANGPQNRPSPPALTSESWIHSNGRSLNGTVNQLTSTHTTPAQNQPHQHRCPTGVSGATSVGPRRLTDKYQRELFVCVLHILSVLTEDQLISLYRNFTSQERIHFLTILKHISRSAVGRSNISGSLKRSVARSVVEPRNASVGSTSGLMDPDSWESESTDFKVLLEANLATEAGLIVLDLLHTFNIVFRQELETCKPNDPIFKGILEVYISLLMHTPSDHLIRHTFAALRMFVGRFAKVLFSESTEILNALCVAGLRCANQNLPQPVSSNSASYTEASSTEDMVTRTANVTCQIRIEACSFLYKLWKTSFETYGTSGFHRVHLQSIISVSKLVSEIQPGFDASLSLLHSLVDTDMRRSPLGREDTKFWTMSNTRTLFLDEVNDLLRRIRTVLTATSEMRRHSDDPEQLVDLHYCLAKSYSSNPALRRTWLEELAKLHMKTHSLAELAMTKLHIAALMVEYLRRRGDYPQGCEAFEVISSNIAQEENGLRTDSAMLEIPYTQEDLLVDINEAAATLDKAGLFEAIRPIYSLVLPVYEARKDYVALAQIFHHIGDAYHRIGNAESNGHRLFAAYFRVTFHGHLFESLSGKSFVYRANACQKLDGICSDLLRLFRNKLGSNSVDLLTDHTFNRDALDMNKGYIQVTYVEPYKPKTDSSSRPLSAYAKHHDVRQFMFETPFVLKPGLSATESLQIDGPKRSEDLTLQWKRRTILTTEASFPHIRLRLEVVGMSETDLSPIDGAIDAIFSKNQELLSHVTTISTSPAQVLDNTGDGCAERVTVTSIGIKSPVQGSLAPNSSEFRGIPLLMDMQLQGALLPTVNAGPMAYAEAFLKLENQSNYPKDKVTRLRGLFFEFLTVCLVLLSQYQRLMSPVHIEKYMMMRQSLDRYRVDLSNLLKEEVLIDEKRLVIGPKSATDDLPPTHPRSMCVNEC